MRRVKELLAVKGDEIWSISPNATVYDAVHLLAEKEIGALLVIDGEALVGVISERDYARQIILKDKSSRGTKVRDIMTANVISATPDQDVGECMTMMTANRIRHLPILQDDKLVGVLSIGDLIRAVIAEQQSTIVDLEKYITG
ncbi:MAG: CBS domain-containing protein [Gammaproteobacteria bacterium]